MKLKVKKPKKVKLKLTSEKSKGKYYMLWWDHYKVSPSFYLIPAKRVSPRLLKVLQRAHNNFIDTERGYIPDDTHQIRMGLSRWLVPYRVMEHQLMFAPELKVNLLGVFYTGQLG